MDEGILEAGAALLEHAFQDFPIQRPSFFVELACEEHWWRHWREQQSCGFYASLVMVPTRSQSMLTGKNLSKFCTYRSILSRKGTKDVSG